MIQSLSFLIVSQKWSIIRYLKVTINAPNITKVIFDVVVWYHNISVSIVIDKGLLFTSEFWSSLCYFFSIKQKFSSAFDPQIDGQTKK